MIAFDAQAYDYPSKRKVVYGRKGMVCTSQPLAAQAGLDVLKRGGNAIDAAIATAVCMTVLEPTSNGLGSDLFAIVWDKKGGIHGLNASGPSPMLIDANKVRMLGHTKMPKNGFVPVNVPGAPGGWAALYDKLGRLPFADLFAPAIDYASGGYPLMPTTAQLWQEDYDRFHACAGGGAPEGGVQSRGGASAEFQPWFNTFAPNGRAPRAGELVRLPDHARTLRQMADSKCEAFYRGALAEQVDAFSRQCGGFLRKEDLAAYHPEWVQPIRTDYRGYDVWEIPPNGHGIVALMALNILSGFEFHARDTADTFHKQIEAMKLAFVDGQRYVADPRYMKVTTGQLLSMDYAASRRALIGAQAIEPVHGDPASGGTVYLCTADGEGNMVSLIQSNYMGFGSGVVVPGTGIALNNRGNNFSLDEAMENCVAPCKKAYHTIIPGFLSKDGEAVGPFGVMGGFMQPQGHVQVVMNLVDFHMNPQQALDAPRWQWVGGRDIQVERAFPYGATEALAARGHNIRVMPSDLAFGRGQVILRDEHGVLVGATEPRADGMVAAW